ncbi:MAG: T9SS type A sorting domain-containing protein [Bacteroidetes bacterium]|nr:T9SS type A sorting domain-containing protein [Bacteroidota bacterium]
MVRQSITILLTFFCVATAVAQERLEAIESLPAASRGAVVQENVWTNLPTTRVANGRIDEQLGILRAAYRLNPDMIPEATPETTARTWLLQDGEPFGILTPEILELVSERESTGALHLTFQQTLADIPVYGRFVHVNLNQTGLPAMVISGYAPHLENVDAFSSVPALSAAQAESLAQRAISDEGATAQPAELLVLPDDPPRLIWQTIVSPDTGIGEWEVLLDANTGTLIQLMDLLVFSHPDPPPKKDVDGEGQIWLYDPLTASGQPYGGDYVDDDDRENATLNSLLQSVTLQDIERTSNGSYRLNGPWVEIVGSATPVESNASDFKYTRSDKHFEAVMVYYFIDTSERYIQSLEVGVAPPSNPVTADPHAFPEDVSYYQASTRSLHFGDGGVDDAEDAGVILHEYGHAIMHHYLGFAPLPRREWGVLGEGFSDYWAVSNRRDLMERGEVPAGDWREVFPWDGIAWGGRRADGNDHYNVIRWDCLGVCDIYDYGRTWAALMMELWERAGRENTDRLHLAAFPYLGRNFALEDMVEALVMADAALNNGQYTADIYDVFEPLGFVTSPSGIPLIIHTPVARHSDPTLPVKIEANINVTGSGYPLTNVSVYYRIDSGAFEMQALAQEGGITWSTEILLPQSATLLEYYLLATTQVGLAASPRSAPANLWSVYVGTDTQAPTVTYTPVTHIVPEEARVPLSIQVADDNAVSKVTLTYTINDPSREGPESGMFDLQDSNGDTYTFNLPLPDTPESVLPGTWLEYRITAHDNADPPNIAVFPPMEEPQLRLDVIPDSSLLGAWNPDDWPGLAAGEWASHEEAFGHQGSLWVTTPDGPYSDKPAQSLLSFPEVNVAGYPNAHLEFWHWYDFENTDVPGPGDAGGIIYDGGQIQLSTDGGQSWTVAEPQWGYNGDIESTLSNPLSGTPAFGGSSFGWRRVRVPLPDAPAGAYRSEVHTRLAFGTGVGNSNSTTDNFAGWAVRDVRILTDPPVDTVVPVVQHAPFTYQFISPDEATTPIQIAALDNTGIESVRLRLYEVENTQLEFLGAYRLNPLQTIPDWFHVAIPISNLQAGGVLGYYITVRDFDNNIRTLGEESAEELLKLYTPSEDPRTALTNGHTSGAWTHSGEGYRARTNADYRQSSIVLAPVYFADRPELTMLRLRHAYQLDGENLGRISVTEDGGDTWEVLAPRTHSFDMDQRDRVEFSGRSPRVSTSWFDLTPLHQPYQLRMDLIHGRQQSGDGFWEVFSAEYYHLAGDSPTVPSPSDLVLYPNFPNPFRDETTISYILPETSHVQITIFNILGQNVQNVTDRTYEAGGHAITLNLRGLAPGIYWVRMEADNTLLQQPITLVR